MTTRRMWYLVSIDGMYRHTHYTPAQTAMVRRGLSAGLGRDGIEGQTGIPYSSLRYVAAIEHKSRVVHGEDTP